MNQRGFLWLPLLLKLAPYLIILIAVGSAWLVIDRKCWTTECKQQQARANSAEEQAAKAVERAKELDAELSQAVAVNQQNLKEVATLRERFEETQKVLDDIQRLQNEQQAKTRAALATFSEREKRQAGEIRRLRVIAETPASVKITDGGASEADAILRNAVLDILGLRQP